MLGFQYRGADVANREFELFLPAVMVQAELLADRRSQSYEDSGSQDDQSDAGRIGASTTPEVCDADLLAGIAARNKEALSVLFYRRAPMIRRLALRILRDPAEAEDLVQEVFLFVFRKAALFDPSRGSVRSWLVQITYHRAFDRRRYLASRHIYSNLELDDAVHRSQEPAVLSTFYDDSIEAALGRDALRRIAESLTPVQSRVVYLVFVEGRTIGEIAALLGQTPGNVRNHYYRALEKMRREVFGGKSEPK